MKNFKFAKVTRALGKVKLGAIKHAPLGLQILGTGLVIAGVIFAINDTAEYQDDLDDIADAIDEVNEQEKKEEITSDEARELRWKYRKEYAKTLVKAYGRTVIAVGSGLGAFYGAQHINAGRIAGLSVSLAGKTAAYNLLAENVEKEYGKEVLDKLKYGLHEDAVEVIEDNGGIEVAHMERVDNVPDLKGYSRYARVFDEDNPYWFDDPLQMNNFFLNIEAVLNNQLRNEHFVFLNRAYQFLGLPRCAEGQVAGWIFDQDNDKIDSRVKLGVQEIKIPSIKYRNGYKRAYIVDFNVDGSIISNFEKYQTVM